MTDREFHELKDLLRHLVDQNALILAHQPFLREGITAMASDIERLRASAAQISTDLGKISADIAAIKDKIAGGISAADAATVADQFDAATTALDAATAALDEVAAPAA